MNAEVKTLEDLLVAYVRKVGAYGPETSEQAFKELGQWAGPRGFFANGQVISMYWDNPEITPTEKCRTDACVTVPEGTAPEGAVSTQTLKGGAYAVCHFETSGLEFRQSWDEAFAWVLEGAHEFMDQPCFEVYHNNGVEDQGGVWKYDICIPLKQE